MSVKYPAAFSRSGLLIADMQTIHCAAQTLGSRSYGDLPKEIRADLLRAKDALTAAQSAIWKLLEEVK